MRTTVRTILIVLVLLAAVLAWTNPDMGDFRTFAVEELEEVATEELGETRLGRLLADAGARLAGAYVEQVTRRQSFLVYSTYTIPLTTREEDEWVFLGIGGRFFELQHPAVLRDDQARIEESPPAENLEISYLESPGSK